MQRRLRSASVIMSYQVSSWCHAALASGLTADTVLLHPDKAPPQHRETAETQFRRLNLAYETLYDPEKRAVYDALGEEGLKTDWRVGQKFKSPEEVS